MSFISDDTEHTARKAYRCAMCESRINIGQRYFRRVGAEDGDFWTMRMHPECLSYSESPEMKQDMEDWYDNGVCSAAFDRADAVEHYELAKAKGQV